MTGKSSTRLRFDIPNNLPDEVKLHMRAQVAIQAVFYSFGDADISAESSDLSTIKLIEVLTTATAMLLAADAGLTTRGAIRSATEAHEKMLRCLVEGLRNDETSKKMLVMLGVKTSMPT